MEKGVWKFEIVLGLLFICFFGRQPLKQGVWRFEIVLGLFSFGRQPLEKGIRRFEIALGLFSNFLGGNPLEKASFL